MLTVKCNVDSIKKLSNYINLVNKLAKLKTSRNFQDFIVEKSVEAFNKVQDDRLVGGTKYNDDDIELYKSHNKVRRHKTGFEIYNDAVIPANSKHGDYSEYGGFPLSLAFEYGTGIVGAEAGIEGAWNYDIHNHIAKNPKGWTLPTDIQTEYGVHHSTGYAGFEIYRYAAEKIQAQLPNWVDEFIANQLNKE